MKEGQGSLISIIIRRGIFKTILSHKVKIINMVAIGKQHKKLQKCGKKH